MLTMFLCADLNQAGDLDFEQRVVNGDPPTVGNVTWMNPDSQDCEWEVISTHLFKSVDLHSDQAVCLVQVAKREVLESSMPTAIRFYLLNGEFYTYAIVGGEARPPEIGDFVEYEPGSNRPLPVTKAVTRYETLTGDASCQVYVVHLQLVTAPVSV